MKSSRPAPPIGFVTGSQHLYGEETLRQVEADAHEIARGIGASEGAPLPVVAKPVLTTQEAVRELMLEANAVPDCAGFVL